MNRKKDKKVSADIVIVSGRNVTEMEAHGKNLK